MPVETHKRKFIIRLKDAHEKMGISPYMVWKKTGISQTTIRKYVEPEQVVTEYIPSVVVLLADFYGVDWRSPSIIEVMGEDDASPENKKLVA